MTATLNESEMAKKLWEVLPCESKANRWGDEVYFEIPLACEPEDPQPEAPSGAIAYWPPGTAFCIFFGQTPYSPVNMLGQVDGDAGKFAKLKAGDAVKLERVE